MKKYINILTVFAVIVSCQTNKKEQSSLISIVEKENTSQNKNSVTYDHLDAKPRLTKEQFNDFFPKEIGAYKLTSVHVEMLNSAAIATYIKNNDYEHSMTYSLQDCNSKGSAEFENFETAYILKPQGPVGTEYVYTERDNYKTIAFLQPTIKRNDIRFIYNNRFRMTLEGTDDLETLWNYFQKEDLQKLDSK